MTNAEKMIQLLKETFNVAPFVSVKFLEDDCFFIECPEDIDDCRKCPYKNFWKEEYKGLTN